MVHLVTYDQYRLFFGRGGVKSCLSVDVWQVLIVPIKVAAGVEPVLGAGEWVSALLEPPE